MERYYTIDAGEPNDVSTPKDDAASTSSMINQVDLPGDHRDQLTHGASTGDFVLQPMETVPLRRIETMAEEHLATRLARIEAHIEGCILRGSSYEFWSHKHEAKLTWATDSINEAIKERDELTTKVEELSELVVELTTRLNQAESQIRSVERVCTFRAADFNTQLHQLQDNQSTGLQDNQSTSTINPESTPSRKPIGPDSSESAHPSIVRREGGDLPPVSADRSREPFPICTITRTSSGLQQSTNTTAQRYRTPVE